MPSTPSAGYPPITLNEVARLAVPAGITALLQNAYRPLDQFYSGYLGGDAQGALGATIFVLIVVYAGFVSMSAGAGPLVARFHGEGNEEGQRQALGAALVGAAAIAVLMVGVGLFAVDGVVWLLGLSGAIAEHARTYLRVILVTGGALAIGPTVDATFASRGNTWFPMLVQGAVIALNAALTPLFIFGAGMGVEGAALGSTVAQTLGVAFSLWVLAREMRLERRHLRAGPMLRRVFRVGRPIAIGTAMYALVYWAMLATSISPLGPDVNAALGVGFSGLEAFSWPLYLGLTVAIASIIGRRLGMGDAEGARRAVRMVVVPQVAIGVGIGAIFWLVGPSIVALFAADDKVYEQAVIYAEAIAWSQPAVAIEALSEGVLSGAGDTHKVFWGTVPFNLLRVPLAWWMAFPLGMGALGVWWAINLSSFLKALVKGAMVLEGSWVRKGI